MSANHGIVKFTASRFKKIRHEVAKNPNNLRAATTRRDA
jgi:hypothetical protein